jgi:hypothetical protein
MITIGAMDNLIMSHRSFHLELLLRLIGLIDTILPILIGRNDIIARLLSSIT